MSLSYFHCTVSFLADYDIHTFYIPGFKFKWVFSNHNDCETVYWVLLDVVLHDCLVFHIQLSVEVCNVCIWWVGCGFCVCMFGVFLAYTSYM